MIGIYLYWRTVFCALLVPAFCIAGGYFMSQVEHQPVFYKVLAFVIAVLGPIGCIGLAEWSYSNAEMWTHYKEKNFRAGVARFFSNFRR